MCRPPYARIMTGIGRRAQCRCVEVVRGRPLRTRLRATGRGGAGPGADLAAHRGGDAGGGDTEPLEKLVGSPAARDPADGEALHYDAVGRHRLAHRIAQTARRVVVLDGDQPVTRPTRGVDQGTRLSTGCTE